MIENLEAQKLAALFDNHLTDLGPEISAPDESGNITISWASNNDGHPIVTFELYDTGNDEDEEKSFDLAISVDNCDNVGPVEMLLQTARCLKQFYDMGLNTRFGTVVGDRGVQELRAALPMLF